MDWPSGAHSNTFGGNPARDAAELANQTRADGLMQNAPEVGQYLHDREARADSHPIGDGGVRM